MFHNPLQFLYLKIIKTFMLKNIKFRVIRNSLLFSCSVLLFNDSTFSSCTNLHELLFLSRRFCFYSPNIINIIKKNQTNK